VDFHACTIDFRTSKRSFLFVQRLISVFMERLSITFYHHFYLTFTKDITFAKPEKHLKQKPKPTK